MTRSSDAIKKLFPHCACGDPVYRKGTTFPVKMKNLCNEWRLIIAVFVIRGGVLVFAEDCNVTQVLECYGDISDNVSDVPDQRTLNKSRLENLCKESDAAERCEEDLASCIDSDPSLKAIQTQYTTIRRDACGNSTFNMSKKEDDPINDDSDEKKCWYRQLKRCLERQINKIRTRMTKNVARAIDPHPGFYIWVCRMKREGCHQKSTLHSCPPLQQDAIRRMEESMNNAQRLLCEDDQALLKNLLLSYKFWDINRFVRCSKKDHLMFITDYLFATTWLKRECREVKSRMLRCLKESYPSIDHAHPKPDVDGATKVLAAFLDRMHCVDALNRSDTNSNDRDQHPLHDSNDYMAGQPVATGTKDSGFPNLKASEELQAGATSLEIASALVAFVSVCFLSRQFLVQ
ncbi:uncharacterized protein [Dermacentor andersoni]|uniref:uncharacterized protein n=1 Tax=Dermacentor andersoni TaxID=34620 RepID=UPI002415E8D1|nr:uncharacterized protein LOC126540562 [Dermacentor andersoni]